MRTWSNLLVVLLVAAGLVSFAGCSVGISDRRVGMLEAAGATGSGSVTLLENLPWVSSSFVAASPEGRETDAGLPSMRLTSPETYRESQPGRISPTGLPKLPPLSEASVVRPDVQPVSALSLAMPAAPPLLPMETSEQNPEH